MAGYGDAIIATGLARGAKARGKRIAFGDRSKIKWSGKDAVIFKNNPNIAMPGDEKDLDIEWIEYYAGNRHYAKCLGGRWIFNNWQCPVGEFFFTPDEKDFGREYALPAVIIEARVKDRGACAGINKQWPIERYQAVATRLQKAGWRVGQFIPPAQRPILAGVDNIYTTTFREAAAVLSNAELYIGPEGGLHHAAAAVGTQAVVIFGGFNTPRSTGYQFHTNIVVGDEPCGNVERCEHCIAAMHAISADTVFKAAVALLDKGRTKQ